MIAVITGTGFGDLFNHLVPVGSVETPYGVVESLQNVTSYDGKVLFLPRHGPVHSVAPHRINYRANISALASLKVTKIVAINVTGLVRSDLPLSTIMIPSQILDYTNGREHTFSNEDFSPESHVDFAYPINAGMSQIFADSCRELEQAFETDVVYACTQGPRLETAAEVKKIAQDGADIIGMTMMPEAILAREKNIAYASLCINVNYASGVNADPLDLSEVHQRISDAKSDVKKLLDSILYKCF